MPEADAGEDQTFDCQTTTITIGGPDSSTGPNITYSWEGPGITATNESEQNPEVAEIGIYTLTVTNTDNDCTATSSVELFIDDQAPATDAGSDQTLTCEIQAVTLDASASATGANITYSWEGPGITADNMNDQNPSVAIQGTYTLTVTNTDNGCSDTDTVEVGQDGDFPDVEAGADQQLTCEILEVQLDGSASAQGPNITYTWAGPGIDASNENEVNPTVGQAGTYTLTVTNTDNGCSDSDTVEVGQDAGVPIAEAGPDQQLDCDTEQVTIGDATTSTGPEFTYEWTGPGITAANANELNPTVDAEGEYILTVTNTDNNCTAVSSMTLSEDIVIPEADAGADQQITCDLTQVLLDASNSSIGEEIEYLWTGPGITAANETELTPTVSEAGTYIITVFNNVNGCESSDEVIITADENIPVASAGDPQTIDCSGDPITLDGSGSTQGPDFIYEWTGPGIDASNANDQNPEVTLSGSYTLTVTNTANNCSAVSNVEIAADVNAPIADAGPTMVLVCEEGPITLDATASDSGPGITYEWSGPGLVIDGNENTLTPNVEVEGIYILTVFNANNGCSNTDEVEVTYECDCVPAADPLGPDQSYCEGTTVPALSVTDNGVDIYNWYASQGSTEIIATGATYDPGVPGTYWVQAFTPAPDNCPSPNMVPITLTELPADDASFQTDNSVYCASDGSINPINIQTSGGTFGTNGTLPINANTGVINIAGAESSSFQIWYVTNGACPDSSGVNVQVIQDPTALVQLEPAICLDDITSIAALSTAGPTATYQWTISGDYDIVSGSLNSAGPLEVSWSDAGMQNVTLTVSDGACSATSTQQIEVISLEASITGASLLLDGETSQLNVIVTGSSSNSFTYEWSPVDGLSCTDCARPIASPLEDVTYTVIVTDEYGCVTTASISIQVFSEPIVMIPNAFSPNGDGLNDDFGLLSNFVQEMEFHIYDRWGVHLFTGNGIDDRWDGTFKGEPVQLDVYVYYARVVFNNGEEAFYKGNVTVLY